MNISSTKCVPCISRVVMESILLDSTVCAICYTKCSQQYNECILSGVEFIYKAPHYAFNLHNGDKSMTVKASSLSYV